MKKLLLFICTFLSYQLIQAQCNCYDVENIALSNDRNGIMEVTFINTCDNNVYHHGWVISKTSNDTIARFDECLCGAVLPLNTPVSWDFKTKLTSIPPLQELRVSIQNANIHCEEVTINQTTAISKSKNKSFKIYPIPFEDKLMVEDQDNGEAQNVPFQITDINGNVMLKGAIENLNSELDLSILPKGFYFIGFYNEQHQRTSFKIVK
ncbi:MAG: T9SS type A sorting domain-containing protein [Sporocytophaga sp.]|nr:T9SS type A sorting domain-containing protein [Sporocytophaga sp.]